MNNSDKEYRVVSLMDTTVAPTDQRVLVAELAEVIYYGGELSTGQRMYRFDTSGDLFVIDFDSRLSQYIIEAEREQDIVKIDFDNFKSKREYRNGGYVSVYYHNSLRRT